MHSHVELVSKLLVMQGSGQIAFEVSTFLPANTQWCIEAEFTSLTSLMKSFPEVSEILARGVNANVVCLMFTWCDLYLLILLFLNRKKNIILHHDQITCHMMEICSEPHAHDGLVCAWVKHVVHKAAWSSYHINSVQLCSKDHKICTWKILAEYDQKIS